ncbi:MAG: hypothetical protein QOD77_1041 [Thermoplasmata archaeon]|jgi:hypothetical protein|nr:hypothetical protein [Thermoplasmata archaeon]
MARKWKHGYTWITAGFFVVSIIGHWVTAYFFFENEQRQHGEPFEWGGYVTETLKDTFENWQSEFLQLLWQVGGLALLLHVGSPSSKEGDDRKEAKLDLLLEKAYGKKQAEALKADLEKDYPKS